MPFPGEEATVGQALALNVECETCGHSRVIDKPYLERFGVTADTKISEASRRFVCTRCEKEGLSGRPISVVAAFRKEIDRLRAEAYLINNRESRAAARPARHASRRTDRK